MLQFLFHKLLLLLPLVLFLVPVGMGSSVNFGQADRQIQLGESTHQKVQIENTSQPSSQTQPEVRETQPEVITPGAQSISVKGYLKIAFGYLVYGWMAGVISLLLYKVGMVIQFRGMLKKIEIGPPASMQAVLDQLNPGDRVKLKCFGSVSTPFITGVFKPVIFMPMAQMSEHEVGMMLTHELTHMKRHDLTIKAFVDLVSIIHFFNPLVYISDLIPITITGLTNPIGGFVEVKSEDGNYYAKYKIVSEIPKPLSLKSSRETSEFITSGENVFIGTPREQDEFDRDEHAVLYKRIMTDDFGKVLAVVPVSGNKGSLLWIKENTVDMKIHN